MNMVNIVVSTLIFVSLIGAIANQVTNPNENITGGALILYGLITLVVVAGFITYLTREMKLTKK